MTLASTYNQTCQDIYDCLKDECEFPLIEVKQEEDVCRFSFPLLSQGVKGIMHVVYRPEREVFIDAVAPFNIDVRAMPIARIWANKEHYGNFYGNPEIDERDGEVRITTTLPYAASEGLPENFRMFVYLTITSLLDELPRLNRYRTCDFTPEEIEQFRDETARLEELLA